MDPRALSIPFLFLAVTPVLASCGSNSCPDGAFRDEAAGFCLVLPAGFAKDKQEDSPLGQRFNFKGPDYGFMSVTVLKDGANELEAQKKSIDADTKKPHEATDVITESGATPQGDGLYRVVNFRGGPTSQLDYAVTTGDKFFTCYTNTGKDKAPSIVAACKSLRGLEKK